MKFFPRLIATIQQPFQLYRKKAPLLSFITGRLVTMLVLLFLLGLALFGLMELAPGDIVDQMMTQQLLSGTQSSGFQGSSGSSSTQQGNFTEMQMEQLRKEFGLDKPFYIQYFKWLERVIFHGDLGTSLISRAPVSFSISSTHSYS